jgi:hypothetical protein
VREALLRVHVVPYLRTHALAALARAAPAPGASPGPARRAALAAIYRRGWEVYQTLPIFAGNLVFDDPARNASRTTAAAAPDSTTCPPCAVAISRAQRCRGAPK